MLGLTGIGQAAIAAFPAQTAPPGSPFYQNKWDNPRGPVGSVALLTWVQSVNLALLGKDKFFGAGGPTYDYPNPRAPERSIELRTWVHGLDIPLYGADVFPGRAGGPAYDWPNPRGPERSIDLRTWTVPYNFALNATPFQLFGSRNFDQPNPRGYWHSNLLHNWVHGTQIQLSDHTFGLGGHPNFDWPNPQPPRYALDLRTWINQGNIQLGRVIGTPTLAFSSDMATATATAGAFAAVVCSASDSPSGQNWSGSGYMARYEIDTSIQIEAIFLNALTNTYIDPSEVMLFVRDPNGAVSDYTNLGPSGGVVQAGLGHYTFTFVPGVSGDWLYKWQGTGVAPATSPDTTLTVHSSAFL